MKLFIIIFLFCIFFPIQAMSCGKVDDLSFKVTVHKGREIKSENCTYFRIIYPKRHENSPLSAAELFIDGGIGAFLEISLEEDRASSIVCMNEETLSKSKIIFTFVDPYAKEGFPSFCIPKNIKIENLDELLAVSDNETKQIIVE